MLTTDNRLYIAHAPSGAIYLQGDMANRHGLIAGATGTGKTVTLQVLAETFSQAGIPCFMADMKGDLSGISQAGKMNNFIEKRCTEFNIDNPRFEGCPVRFFDIFGERGHAMRTTISEMGPQLLARLLQLNETQTGILNITFRIADDNNLLLIDIKDLRLMLDHVAKNAKQYTTEYGNISSASIGAIQRALLALESEGGDKFFGEPTFDINNLLETHNNRGIMNVLAADRLMLNPKLYSTFLLWLLSELYENLPEVGDCPQPKLAFFFDEAHMLFKDTSKALVEKIEQVVRLIRSKGVGVYFVTQSPTDIPEEILGQLGNRIQHALRAFTPKDQKAVRAAAQTFRANPDFSTDEAITQLGTGEALVSLLDENGAPSVVQRAKILFPLSQIGAITDGQRLDCLNADPQHIKAYDRAIDRESAYEILTQDNEQESQEQELSEEKNNKRTTKQPDNKQESSIGRGILGTIIGAAATSFVRSLGNSLAKSLFGSGSKNALEKATRSATNTATRKIVNTAIKKIIK